jgi:hypothetical protein
MALACLLAACSAGPAHPVDAAADPAPAAGRAAAAPLSSPPAAAQLVGMSAEQITRLLGRPHRSRREAPAQVWQYAAANCVMFVFLYEGGPATGGQPAVSAHGWRVQYIEALSRNDAKPVPTAECLSGLIGRRPAALGEG